MTDFIIQPKQIMPFNYLNSVKTYISEMCMTIILGFTGIFTLANAPVIITIVGTLFTAALFPAIFGYLKYKRIAKQDDIKFKKEKEELEYNYAMQREREHEKHVALMIKQLVDNGIINATDSIQEKRKQVMDFINQINIK